MGDGTDAWSPATVPTGATAPCHIPAARTTTGLAITAANPSSTAPVRTRTVRSEVIVRTTIRILEALGLFRVKERQPSMKQREGERAELYAQLLLLIN